MRAADGEDANEALKLLDEDVADPVAIGLLGAAAKACGIVRDERFLDDLDLDEETCEIEAGRVPPYVVQAELRRLTTASPARRAAALKLALAAAACGSLHEAVVEVEVPAAVVESSRRWPEAARAVVAQLRAILQNDHGPALSCFRANGGVLLRRGAARACALLQDPPSSVIQACLALACDSDSVVRANAADALAPGLSPAAAVVTVAAEFTGVVPVKAKALLARRAALEGGSPAAAPPGLVVDAPPPPPSPISPATPPSALAPTASSRRCPIRRRSARPRRRRSRRPSARPRRRRRRRRRRRASPWTCRASRPRRRRSPSRRRPTPSRAARCPRLIKRA